MLRASAVFVAAAASVLAAGPLAAQATEENGPPIEVRRVSSPIVVDGDLSDAAWGETLAVEEWFETNPGDNLPASVRNVARLGYDAEFLYAAFEFDDPDPATIRAPLGDRDNVNSTTDYGGVILDSRNDAKTAQMFLANAAGIQYDALTNDAAGEDSAPDFYWESAGRVHRARLAARDAHPLLVDPLHRLESRPVGHAALPQPAARLPLPVLQLAPAARPRPASSATCGRWWA